MVERRARGGFAARIGVGAEGGVSVEETIQVPVSRLFRRQLTAQASKGRWNLAESSGTDRIDSLAPWHHPVQYAILLVSFLLSSGRNQHAHRALVLRNFQNCAPKTELSREIAPELIVNLGEPQNSRCATPAFRSQSRAQLFNALSLFQPR